MKVVFLLFIIIILSITLIHESFGQEYVQVTKDANGVWWFVQNGNKFITRGVNHVNNGGWDDGVGGRESAECQPKYPLCGDTLSFSSTLGYAPYYNTTIARYGNATAWAANTKNRLQAWGFNSIGGWSSTLMEQQGLYYAHLLDIGTTWLNSRWLPDLFDPLFEAQCMEIAQKECLPRANDTRLLGYQTDNEVGWTGINFLTTYLLFNTTAYGYKGAISYLQTTYTTIQNLNKAWNINAANWSDVPSLLNSPSINKAAFQNDTNKFMGICASRYFQISSAAIKKYDSNHLLLSARFSDLPIPVLEALIPYVDVVDQHFYEFEPNIPWLQTIHNISGKPVMVGEFSFTAVDSNMPNTRGAWANNPLVTQSDRATHFTSFVTELLAQPYAVGFHWWQWADEPSSGRWPDGEDSNYGLVHIDDDEYQLLTQEMTRTNAVLDKLHQTSYLNSNILNW